MPELPTDSLSTVSVSAWSRSLRCQSIFINQSDGTVSQQRFHQQRIYVRQRFHQLCQTTISSAMSDHDFINKGSMSDHDFISYVRPRFHQQRIDVRPRFHQQRIDVRPRFHQERIYVRPLSVLSHKDEAPKGAISPEQRGRFWRHCGVCR